MEKPLVDEVAPIGKESPVRKLVRLHFELALELGFASKRPLHETLWNALNTAGCDVILQLPTPDAEGVITIVRLREAEQEGFLQVRLAEYGFAIADEAEIHPDLLSFARASIDVLDRIRADDAILEPSAAARH